MARKPDNWIPTRRSLLSRLKNWEDQESWQDFFNTYWRLIYGVALKAGLSDTESQEVVQETVIAVAKRIPEFKYDPARGSFKNWLLHTTQWKIGDQFRKRHKEGFDGGVRSPASGRATIDWIPDNGGCDLESVWDDEWSKNIFTAAIEKVKRQVNARQYQIFDLYVIKEWPVERVARTLGVSPGRVYLAKHRITELIRKEVRNLETATV